jgi:hypothetical protein
MKSKPALVLCLPENEYRRYLGKHMTNRLYSETHLGKYWIERFRKYPQEFIEHEPDLVA